MSIRGIHNTAPTPLARVANQIRNLTRRIQTIESQSRREFMRAKGYEFEYRTTPTPGLYLVNKRDGDPNFGTATFLGP